MTRLRYVAREAFQNIGRNALVVLGAILAVFISLTLTFGTVVFGEVVRINTLQWAEDVRVIAQGGDGGTTDIGFGCLSGMFDRNDDVLYICYNNEAYMNTGVQRSSATPGAARTATTMPVGEQPGNEFNTGKSVPLVAMAHNIPYVATASVHDLHDLEYKVTKAMNVRGSRYIEKTSRTQGQVRLPGS